jgi:hypothetical protein
MPTVALASEFLDAYARLPRAQQEKVREFTETFKADPRSPAINYEKILQVKDDKVRMVRIDMHYRAIVRPSARKSPGARQLVRESGRSEAAPPGRMGCPTLLPGAPTGERQAFFSPGWGRAR